MQLAFVLYKYFPFGGLQRDFMRIALECQQRGHQIRVYTMIWEGDIPPGFDVLVAPVKAFHNHTRLRQGANPLGQRLSLRAVPAKKMYLFADCTGPAAV